MEGRSRYLVVFMILSIFPVYVFAVNSLPSDISMGESCQPENRTERHVGFCTSVSATVVRDYYYGQIPMKTTVLGLNIDYLNRIIGAITVFLSAVSLKFLNES